VLTAICVAGVPFESAEGKTPRPAVKKSPPAAEAADTPKVIPSSGASVQVKKGERLRFLGANVLETVVDDELILKPMVEGEVIEIWAVDATVTGLHFKMKSGETRHLTVVVLPSDAPKKPLAAAPAKPVGPVNGGALPQQGGFVSVYRNEPTRFDAPGIKSVSSSEPNNLEARVIDGKVELKALRTGSAIYVVLEIAERTLPYGFYVTARIRGDKLVLKPGEQKVLEVADISKTSVGDFSVAGLNQISRSSLLIVAKSPGVTVLDIEQFSGVHIDYAIEVIAPGKSL
jgi:hypothetical protein